MQLAVRVCRLAEWNPSPAQGSVVPQEDFDLLFEIGVIFGEVGTKKDVQTGPGHFSPKDSGSQAGAFSSQMRSLPAWLTDPLVADRVAIIGTSTKVALR